MTNRLDEIWFSVTRIVCSTTPPIVSGRLRKMLLPSHRAYAMAMPYKTRSQTGSFYKAVTDEYHTYQFGLHGFCTWRNWAVALALVEREDTIFEIGANVGTETIGYSDIVGDEGNVVAFEPVQKNVDRVRRHLGERRHDNIHFVEKAVSSSVGTVHFKKSAVETSTGTGHIVKGKIDEESIEVEVTMLDRFVEWQPKLIYMDVEGSEVDVLRGGAQLIEKARPYIVCEASPKCLDRMGYTLKDLYDVLISYGYKVYEISRFGLSQVDGLDYVRSKDWFCTPSNDDEAVKKVSRMILRCALMPCVLGLNPMRIH